MLKLRSIGIDDYRVLDVGQRIGRVRFVIERLPGGLPTGSSPDFSTAKAEFKAAWKALKASTTPEQLAAAYAAMNIRDDDG